MRALAPTAQRRRRAYSCIPHTGHHDIALVSTSFRSRTCVAIMTEASTVSKVQYARSTVSKKRIKTPAASTSRVLPRPGRLPSRKAAHERRCQPNPSDQHARPVQWHAHITERSRCSHHTVRVASGCAIAAGICMAPARSRSAAPSGNSAATGRFWGSKRLETSGTVSEVSGVAPSFRLPASKHEAPYEKDRRIERSAQAVSSPPEPREARDLSGLGKFSRPLTRAVATATAASCGVANEPRPTRDCLAASHTLACHGCFLRFTGYTSLYPLLVFGLRTSSWTPNISTQRRLPGATASFEREASISTRRTLRKRGAGFYETF
jgi:hypothetical protein